MYALGHILLLTRNADYNNTGDGERPVCQKCAIRKRDCVRPSKPTKFVIHGATPATLHKADHGASIVIQNEPVTERARHNPSGGNAPQCLSRIDHAQSLASYDPPVALKDLDIAKLFAHYVDVLAAWYDLNDPTRTFRIIVPEAALRVPLLFKAIIAFSACHWNQMHGELAEIATAFHAACVAEFLRIMESPDVRFPGGELAATCLLRSFEIINGGSRTESHLLGAYSYAINESIDFSQGGLLQAGAWNYLREEITAALIWHRGVRLGHIFDNHTQNGFEHSLPADRISYLLARTINFCFGDVSLQTFLQERLVLWRSLHEDLLLWKTGLPSSFEPFTTVPMTGNPFPSLWMLQPWHVAAQQYCAVAEILLLLYDPSPSGGHLSHRSFQLAQEKALRVCGLAWTNENDAAHVNAFGPLAFCGRYLSSKHHQDALKEFLLRSSARTGWPVSGIIESLQSYWASEYQ